MAWAASQEVAAVDRTMYGPLLHQTPEAAKRNKQKWFSGRPKVLETS